MLRQQKISKEVENSFKPQYLVFQWHITERCNWHCQHCYQNENPVSDLTLEQLFHIFEQFLFLVKEWKIRPGQAFLNITGGEPFIRKDLFQFLEKVADNARLYRYLWTLMSNGSLLNEENVKKIKEMKIARFQVSIEGMEKNNDEIRGKGAFKKTIEAIKLLVKNRIPTRVSLTLTKKNMGDIPALAKLCDNLGVFGLGTRRLIPWGRGKELEEYMLQPRELRDYFFKVNEINKKLLKKKSRLRVVLGCESSIFNEEVLADAEGNMPINFCGVTQGRVLTIMANGDILPCRRLPIVVGNALKDNIYNVYYSPQMQDFRNLDKLHPFCQKCPNFSNCFGGAKCVIYAYAGKWNIPDVQCWRAYRKLNEPIFT